MIEGVRVLPYWLGALAENPQDPRRDCDGCMSRYTPRERQAFGCGYLPRREGRLGLWAPQPLVDDWNATDPKEREADAVMHCTGYTTKLPEVLEVARAYPHFKAGYLTEALGEPPSPELLDLCALLDRENNRYDAWRMEEMRKDAERKRQMGGG